MNVLLGDFFVGEQCNLQCIEEVVVDLFVLFDFGLIGVVVFGVFCEECIDVVVVVEGDG